MKSTIIAVLAILAISTTSLIYADEIPMPVLPTDNWTGTEVKTFYPTNSTYIVKISVHYTVESPFDVVERLTWFDIYGQIHTIFLQEEFNLTHFAPVPEPVPVKESRVDTEEIQRVLDKKRAEMALSIDNGFSKLRQCLIEFEAEQPIRFEAWARIAELTEFTIPDEWISSFDYDRFELEAQKKWVICDALKKYQWIGVQEANMIQDDTAPWTLDETDNPLTIDVTPEMIDAEAQRAQDYLCSENGKARGYCGKVFDGVNRGSTEYSLPQWYAKYQRENTAGNDAQAAIDQAMQTQCQMYLPMYSGKIGTDALPEWLGHCVP